MNDEDFDSPFDEIFDLEFKRLETEHKKFKRRIKLAKIFACIGFVLSIAAMVLNAYIILKK